MCAKELNLISDGFLERDCSWKGVCTNSYHLSSKRTRDQQECLEFCKSTSNCNFFTYTSRDAPHYNIIKTAESSINLYHILDWVYSTGSGYKVKSFKADTPFGGGCGSEGRIHIWTLRPTKIKRGSGG
jgi:hypothetical protein